MCGLTGFFQACSEQLPFSAVITRMCDQIVHRGPDDSGIWLDESVALALGHRRLSILDLSPAGHQPMLSECGRYVIAFNGEIYNHLLLRAQLQAENKAPHWRGHSDTETLLACFAAWGVEATLQATGGMFAIALWDKQQQVLTLARDRMGEKPLYWGWCDDVLLFGSELKALRAHPAFNAEIDRNALSLLLRHCYIPAPFSIYQGIQKLMPGCFVCIPLGDSVEASKAVQPHSYWRMNDAIEKGLADPFSGSPEEAVALLEQQLSDSIGEQMLADDALAVIPHLPQMYSEPFSDSSQIPTFLVSQMARQHVTVALSGDGGDELFGGYNRYLAARKVWGAVQRLPAFTRRAAAGLLRAVPPATWDKLFQRAKPVLPKRLQLSIPGEKARKLADVLSLSDGHAFYRQLTSHWTDPASVVIGATEPATLITTNAAWPKTDSLEHAMMAMDAQTYMADDILTKVDRAAMAISLETRVPMLDHRVVELAWRMPLNLKIRDGQGKWLLRQVLYKHVPKALIERPKTGFGIPLDSWLRGPLRGWAEALLDERRLRQEGYFHPEPIRKMWAEHLSGKHNWQYHLWSVLMFQAWLEDQ